ncbi:tyrosine-type recombinase/integrase [Sinorhizobium medicae]|uniref:tyrosine-type recombinase/integrase n=1 Tax=Sinorhizobium medicae TaxID=110321 RepID=UPI0011A0FB77|nr:tyrosine-type recombinase/integrase [Sinorhizobium medicae]MDX0470163.1 tyrosine-type recombinase/integrase [Sinorhizobium medicae]MDX0661275.1 tyrosine-type recombinase/integrase [Sinorhizobium medicae]MDX1177270.1 tyrosine-type recombinase/integrase [Sinorhizobium medicae]MDX1200113.1 tyrosine-type recombinase/integrase [Sinorhizobium medicae]MDX1225467.1 tyrosine-type recombinase/integrase [Sinorhizobium medicae]
MSLLAEQDRYLSIRRRLGADLSTDERILRRFAAFVDNDGAEYIDTRLIMRWLESLPSASAGTRGARFRVARQFAAWLHGTDPRHEVPPQGLVPGHVQRVHPHIYSDAEIIAIIEHARSLPSVYGMRGLTCSTLFGLIAVTGLRINEALRLDQTDLDIETGVLRVRFGKLGKERLLPLDPTVAQKLESYGRERDRLLGRRSEALFVACKGHRLGDCGARYNFALVCQQIGLRPRQDYKRHGRGPRIHDLRHTFAVRTMLNWYRSGHDVGREMIKLTTWLGHASPTDTYWYLEAVPELLVLAAARITSAAEGEQ